MTEPELNKTVITESVFREQLQNAIDTGSYVFEDTVLVEPEPVRNMDWTAMSGISREDFIRKWGKCPFDMSLGLRFAVLSVTAVRLPVGLVICGAHRFFIFTQNGVASVTPNGILHGGYVLRGRGYCMAEPDFTVTADADGHEIGNGELPECAGLGNFISTLRPEWVIKTGRAFRTFFERNGTAGKTVTMSKDTDYFR